MRGDLQSRIKPHASPNTLTFNKGELAHKPDPSTEVRDSKIQFKDLILNANSEFKLQQAAKSDPNDLSSAKNDEEFFEMLSSRKGVTENRQPTANLDKEAFMKLFVTQLQHQDPLNPDDSAKMAAQLAQFQGLEQMMNINDGIKSLGDETKLSRAVNLIDFVGRDIAIDSGRMNYKNGALSRATFELQEDVPQAILEVRDSAGSIVSKQELGLLKSGKHSVNWSGKSLEGKPVNEGVYTFSIMASDLEGNQLIVPLKSQVKVTGVDLQSSGGAGAFHTELGPITVESVKSVGDSGFLKAPPTTNVAPVDQTKEKDSQHKNGVTTSGMDVETGTELKELAKTTKEDAKQDPEGNTQGKVPKLNLANEDEITAPATQLAELDGPLRSTF
jgi:flagellar basal-body rod modification protein FlgD